MIEVRVLEGPNIHFSEPAVELAIDGQLLIGSAEPERLLATIARWAGADM